MIAFKLDEGAKLPRRGSSLAAGMDIHCTGMFTLYPKEQALISTGVRLAECPPDVYLRVAPRSKLANRYGINILAGVVDSDYRGEIKVILHNTGHEIVSFWQGDAIAQLIPELVMMTDPVEAYEMSETERGEAGIDDKELRL